MWKCILLNHLGRRVEVYLKEPTPVLELPDPYQRISSSSWKESDYSDLLKQPPKPKTMRFVVSSVNQITKEIIYLEEII